MKQVNKWLWIGIIVWFAGNIIRNIPEQQHNTSSPLIFIGDVVFFIGVGLFIYGCTLYAKKKGYSWYVGLLGLLSVLGGLLGLIGLVVLVLLPQKKPFMR